MFYVYLLYSHTHNQWYVGSTSDLRKRVDEHNAGKSASTKRYLPWKMLYYEAYTEKALARIRERKLKHHGKGLAELNKRVLLN